MALPVRAVCFGRSQRGHEWAGERGLAQCNVRRLPKRCLGRWKLRSPSRASTSPPTWEPFGPARPRPVFLRLTNSIIIGSVASGPGLITNHCVLNPASPVFQSSAGGNYYLTDGSPYQNGGTTNISARLLAELRQKTTQPPLAFPNQTILKGELILLPRVTRGGGGTLALGYHYDALDYTVATLTLQGATVTIEPGTAIAVRYDPWPDMPGYFSFIGFDLGNGARLVGCGTPTRPVTFTTVQLVQEQPCPLNYCVNLLPDLPLDGDTPPTLDFRFCNFYFGSQDYQVLAGMTSYYGWTPSDNSSLNWALRDSNLRGGGINLGYPGSYFLETLPPGSVSWVNNVFEQVDINLDPTYYWMNPYLLNVDLPFQASNNLFRGGRLRLVPIPTSAGNWALRDNLFERVVFQQDSYLPLDHDHNAYWRCSQSELDAAPSDWLGPGSASQLGGSTGGTNNPASDPILTAAPPYQAGPFGDYYLPATTPLYHAGSRIANEAGLFHYTTRVDQTKEGSGQRANIGPHYVATTGPTDSQPKDSDGDGIPDYVENASGTGTVGANETDWQNPYTAEGVYDPTNALYDNVDLSGNGLVGRFKKALGISAFDPGNPLTLTPVALDGKWGVLTCEVAIRYNVLTNIGRLNLNMNGIDVTLEDVGPATNGNTLLNWNTTYEPPGQQFMQPRLTLSGPGGDHAVMSGLGFLVPNYSSNVVQFFETDALFDDTSAFLDAQLPALNADYTIRLYDPSTTPPTFISAITNSTYSGIIQEDWNLTYGDGVTLFTGSQVEAVFDVTLLDQVSGTLTANRLTQTSGTTTAHGQHAKKLNRIVTKEKLTASGYDGFDVVYFYTPTNNALSSLFYHGEVWYGMQGVVDILTLPQWPWEVYYSYFNIPGYPTIFNGYPGYLTSRDTVTNLLYPDLGNGTTKNFYGYGHGNKDYLGTKNNEVFMTAPEVAGILANQFKSSGGLCVTNPYRFVFLDGCKTAAGKDWRRAFGIMPFWATNQAARYKLGPQAYVGWESDKSDYLGGINTTNGTDMESSTVLATAYTETLQYFFLDWMNGTSLAQCIPRRLQH